MNRALPKAKPSPKSSSEPDHAESARWAAVRARVEASGDPFVYAVTTTGIYCRSGCPSRQPSRAHVLFFDDATAARSAGFRACLRCHPDGQSLYTQHIRCITALCRRLETERPLPRFDDLVAGTPWGADYVRRIFKKLTGVTPHAYAAAVREQRVRQDLRRTDGVTQAVYQAGYQSPSQFYAHADRILGMTPRAFCAGGVAVRVQVAVEPCSLGHVLIAAGPRGICAIFLGDKPTQLHEQLGQLLPRAQIVPGDAAFARLVARIVAFVDQPQRGLELDLPLDVRGTAFQKRVWTALQTIPFGRTATYSEIAAHIGSPRAVRAVASACAANALAVVIPCHRVVQKSGALAGYRWGASRKRKLLDRERDD